MHIAQALDLVSRYDSLRTPMTYLGDFLDPELISRCLAESGTVTLCKRHLPLEMIVWCVIGMALERKEPLNQNVNWLESCGMVMQMLMTLLGASPGQIPELMRDMAQMVKLPIRRKRAFPRVVKESPRKYGKAWNKMQSVA